MSSAWSLTNHITQFMTRPRVGDPRQPSLWPSDASAQVINEHGETEIVGSCRRATFFRYTIDNFLFDPTKHAKYEPLVDELLRLKIEPEKYMRWIWEAGKLFEDHVIEQAKQSGVYVAEQVQIVIPEYNIVGKLDLIVRNPDTGGFIAEEVKSVYGHNANNILGTPTKRKLGKPREGNMMQLAIYDWHLKKRMSGLEDSRLLYGARDTGRYAEFSVSAESGKGIEYQAVSPWLESPVTSPITIDAMLQEYKYVEAAFQAGDVPNKDFDLAHSDERLQTMYDRDEMSKTKREAYEKILQRRQENIERVAEGKAPKKELKSIESGDFQCNYCEYRKYCWGQDA